MEPKRVSSRLTFFYKDILPTIWFGFLGVMLVTVVCSQFGRNKAPLPFLLMPLALGVFGYVLMSRLMLDLVDGVLEAGTYLVVRNRGEEHRIAFSEIASVDYQYLVNPPRVTLALRSTTKLGGKVPFMAPPGRPFCATNAPTRSSSESSMAGTSGADDRGREARGASLSGTGEDS